MLTNHAASRVLSNIVRFDCYEVDLNSGELRKRGIKLGLREQSFQVLGALLQHPGNVVSREELRHRLWGDAVFVNFENNLNAIVAHLREVLCDSAERPRFIETLPKRGYRFVAEVQAFPATKASRARIVVLPFLNLNGDPTQEYFSDAMSDEITTALAGLAPEHLAVIARTTAMHYKESHKDVARIGRELGVDYVVEGALRHDQQRVAVNVQLIQTSDQTHLFARRYNADLRELFQLQDSIARDVAAHIDGSGVQAEISANRPLTHRRKNPTENLSAYNEYIQGRYLAERLTPEAMASARQHFEEALRRDPEFALAHLALADLYSWLGYLGYTRPVDAYSTGFQYALRAAEIDDSLAEAHAVLAEYHKQLDYSWPAAEREMARALELSPASPFVRLRHAIMILMPKNHMAEAVAEIRRALESDPLAGATRFWLGIMLLLAREYDRAIDEARGLLELEPASPWPHYITGVAYRQKYFEASAATGRDATTDPELRGFAEQAIAGHLKALELSPGSDVLLGWLGLAYGACGRRAEALGVLEQLRRSERYILPTSFGHVHLGLGEFDVALEWFGRAVEERDQVMMPILSYAHFDPLRGNPRFAALLRKMKLAP